MGWLARALLIAGAGLCAACGPSLQECLRDATKRPSDTGVRVAVFQCNKQFSVEQNKSEIDQFLEMPANDTAEQWITVILFAFGVVAANALVAFGVARLNLGAAMVLLRIERLIAGLGIVVGTVQLMPVLTWLTHPEGVTGSMIAQATLKGLAMVIFALMFLGLRKVINWVHTVHRGVPHPSLGKSPWAMW